MGLLARWELWTAVIVNLVGGALQYKLIPTGTKWEAAAMWAMQGLGSIGLVFGKQLAGKSNTERMKEAEPGTPAERATDDPPPPPAAAK